VLIGEPLLNCFGARVSWLTRLLCSRVSKQKCTGVARHQGTNWQHLVAVLLATVTIRCLICVNCTKISLPPCTQVDTLLLRKQLGRASQLSNATSFFNKSLDRKSTRL